MKQEETEGMEREELLAIIDACLPYVLHGSPPPGPKLQRDLEHVSLIARCMQALGRETTPDGIQKPKPLIAQMREERDALKKVIDEANANAPTALSEALESLTEQSVLREKAEAELHKALGLIEVLNEFLHPVQGEPRRVFSKQLGEAYDRYIGDQSLGAIENGIRGGIVDHHGELELILTVDGRDGSVFISREFWEAVGDAFDDPKRKNVRQVQKSRSNARVKHGGIRQDAKRQK